MQPNDPSRLAGPEVSRSLANTTETGDPSPTHDTPYGDCVHLPGWIDALYATIADMHARLTQEEAKSARLGAEAEWLRDVAHDACMAKASAERMLQAKVEEIAEWQRAHFAALRDWKDKAREACEATIRAQRAELSLAADRLGPRKVTACAPTDDYAAFDDDIPF